MEGYISEIRFFGPNWAPRNWFACQGQILPIAQYSAFFSLIGTMYGGDGRSTFGLPDLRGRVIVGIGAGPGRTPRNSGQAGGSEMVTLNVLEMPTHNHAANTTLSGASAQIASSAAGSTGTPSAGIYPGVVTDVNGDPVNVYGSGGNPITSAVSGNAATQIGNTGGNQAHENMQPWQAILPIICFQGIFPSRS